MITGPSIDSTQSSGLPKTMISSMIYPNFDHMGHNISIKEVLGKMKTSLIIKYLIKIHETFDQIQVLIISNKKFDFYWAIQS